jgi:glycosyltransferase involved in cell wall biosynthesis
MSIESDRATTAPDEPLIDPTSVEGQTRHHRDPSGVPLVSIIIATLNAESTLDRCLRSLWSQDHPRREVIVMDGGSDDRTLDVLGENGDRIAHWESEPDRGTYHAWNKGLNVATGQWVCFLGADDYFPSSDRLSLLVAEAVNQDADLVLGRGAVVDDQGHQLRVIGEPWDRMRLLRHQYVLHPAMLHRRSLFDRYGGFDDSYRIAGDYAFLLRLTEDVRATFVDDVVVCISGGGLSRRRLFLVLRETWQVQARQPEIGPFRATLNGGDTAIKALARSLMRQPA